MHSTDFEVWQHSQKKYSRAGKPRRETPQKHYHQIRRVLAQRFVRTTRKSNRNEDIALTESAAEDISLRESAAYDVHIWARPIAKRTRFLSQSKKEKRFMKNGSSSQVSLTVQ
jgi:hypothetical protein